MFPLKGRILALDLGEKRIGVALSDPTRTIAQSLTVLLRQSRRQDYAQIAQLIATHQVNLLLVGLPVPLNGLEGSKAAWVRDYTAELQQHIPIPVQFWDESLTTVKAYDSLRQRGKHARQAKDRIDAVAAAFILQSYLDAQGADG